MKTAVLLDNFSHLANVFLPLLSDTTHSHIGSVLRYGHPGLELIIKWSSIQYVTYDENDLLQLLLPFYVSNISLLESKWCAPDTTQLTVGAFKEKYESNAFVPQRDTVCEMLTHSGFNFSYSGFGLVVSHNGTSVIVDGSKRACIASLRNEVFHAIEIESPLVPLLWSCEFFQSAVKE